MIPTTTPSSPSSSTPSSTFAQLELAAPLLQAIVQQGYDRPTPIQAAAIAPIMRGADVLGCAQTGTGKTAAFALPLLHRLLVEPAPPRRPGSVRVLVLAPTRELALQIDESFATYGRNVRHTRAVILGGVAQGQQVRALAPGVDVVVATPGRLLDLLSQRALNLSQVQTLVLDEADRMLDMGFVKDVRTIVGMTPPTRQTLLFSATMPQAVRALASSLLRQPVEIAVAKVSSTAEGVAQYVLFVDQQQKGALLGHVLRDPALTRALVFTRTKHGANRVADQLSRRQIAVGVIHANKSQNARVRALDAFRSGQTRVLVATDIAARGIDVDDVSHVINFDLPADPESYVHRIGRTARAGRQGTALSFCQPAERSALRSIERITGKQLRVMELPGGETSRPAPGPRVGVGGPRSQSTADLDA